MSELHLTPKQAKALGIVAEVRKQRATRKAQPASAAAPNRCVACGELVKGETATVRHMAETGHLRYEMVLETLHNDARTTESDVPGLTSD